MSSIRIISTPPGQAPEEVRKEWIGVVIPLLPGQKEDAIGRGVVDGKITNENRGGYVVSAVESFKQLKEKSSKAAMWWEENFGDGEGVNFVFAKSCAELVP